MSSRQHPAVEAPEPWRDPLEARNREAPPVPFAMGIFQSAVRHFVSTFFAGWQDAALPDHDANRQENPTSNARSQAQGKGTSLGTHERDAEGASGPASKRRRLTPPNDNNENRARPAHQKRGPAQRFSQSQPASTLRSQQRPTSSISRHIGYQSPILSQSLNRQSIRRAQEQREKAADAQRSFLQHAPGPLLTAPQTREEIDNLFMPKRHGLLDEKNVYPTPDATPQAGTSSADQSPQHDMHGTFSNSYGSAGSRTSPESTPFNYQAGRFDISASIRSTYPRPPRPIRRDSGPPEPIDYAERIRALLDEDNEEELQFSTRKQKQIEDARRQREAERLKREKEAEEKRLQEEAESRLKRRIPKKPLIQPLEKEWEDRVNNTVNTNNPGQILTTSVGGTELIPKDFRTLLGPRSWLNDEIINSYIEWIVDSANKMSPPNKAIGKEKPVPKFIAHNSFFYENITKKGPTSTDRLMKRKGAPGKSLLQVDSVIVPICRSSHWTVGVVRPAFKTIEYFDSFGGQSSTGIEFKKHMRAWLQHQLADSYIASEWSEPNTGCASQTNGYDCGVFVCTNAFCVAFGLETSCYQERDLGTQRRRIAAVLINRGFHGDFSWQNDGL